MTGSQETMALTLTPPRWVRARQTVGDWARISHVRLRAWRADATGRVAFTVQGAPADIAQFQRIVALNTADW